MEKTRLTKLKRLRKLKQRQQAAARLAAREKYPTPGTIAVAVQPRTVQTPALDILDAALMDAENGTHPQLIFTMPPQEGKSVRVSRAFPLWLLMRNPELRIAVMSYSDRLARRWGRAVKNDIINNPQLGLSVRRDTSAANEWQLEGHEGGMVTVGIGGGLTGRPVDVMIIDDPFEDMDQADSETFREAAKEWWRTTGSTRLSEGAIVVLIQTRWHEDDLAGWFLAENPGDWHHINIPAIADHKPAEGETDILGRQVGQWMISARGRTAAGWEKRRRDAGSRGFAAMYQGRPSPAEGGILKRSWWRYYTTPRAVQRSTGLWHAIGADEVIISVDCAFEDADTSDWVVMQVWGRRGTRAWLLNQVRDHLDLPGTVAALSQLAALWPQAKRKLVEKKANGHAVIQVLRGKVGGVVAVEPKDSKVSRVNGVSAFIEGGDVELPDPKIAPWVGGFVDECASFPNGTHDDQVDTMTQALDRLLSGGGASKFMDDLLANPDED